MSYTFEKLDMAGATVYYCPNYFTDHEIWYQLINESVNWQKFMVKVYGRMVEQPRESFYMADDGHPYKYSGIDRPPEKWEVAIVEMKKILNKLMTEIEPEHPPLNAVLGNKYSDGTDYIGSHSDNESDLNPLAFIVSVSLGSSRDFIFTHKTTKQKVKICLKPGSIILMGGDCQKNWKHEVPKRLKVKDPRINLTFRSIVFRENML